jgi:hypothetical protein
LPDARQDVINQELLNKTKKINSNINIMATKLQRAVIGGIAGTAAMTMVIFLAPFIGMPKMSPPAMLSMMTGLPILAGWLMHLMIGIIYALIYAFIVINMLKRISSNLLKGLIFGMFAFVFGMIMIALMGTVSGGMPAMEGSMMGILAGGLIGHLIYGIVTVLVIRE